MDATGTFEVTLTPQPAEEVLRRLRIEKVFSGGIEGTSRGEMLSLVSDDGSAGYVAIERVEGSLNGRSGSFALQHHATMRGGVPESLVIQVVPGSGTGELAGIEGRMQLDIRDGVHAYRFEYDL